MEKSMFQGLKSEKSIFKGPKCGKIHVSRVENQRRRVVAPELDPRHGMLAAETMLAYSIEQEGGRIVHGGFIKTALAKACGLFGNLWEKVASDLEPGAFAQCGSITNVAVVATMPEATHLAGFSIRAENSVASILDMGVTAVKFQAAKPALPAPVRPLGLVLNRAPAIPPLEPELGSGRPANDELYAKLRAQLMIDGAKGHRDPKIAKKFMGKVVKLLYASKGGAAVLWLWPSRERAEI